MQIARKNQHLLMIVRGNREIEPQINADERRFVDWDFQHYSKDGKPQCSYSKHGALKHENEPQNTTRMTQIKRMFTYPRSIVVLILAQNQLKGRYLGLSAFIRGFFVLSWTIKSPKYN